MVIKKLNIVGLFQGLLLFLIFWTAKKPLEFLLNGVSNDLIYLVGAALMVFTIVVSLILLKLDYSGAAIFQLLIMLIFLPIALTHGNEFGAYKAFSLVLMLNLMGIVFLINRLSFSIETILLTMAGLFLFYGVISGIMAQLLGSSFQRGIIGFNGPIVFGQYMVLSFTIYLLYGHKLRGAMAFLLSLLSFSKGPFLGGLLAAYLTSRNKFQLVLISLPFVAIAIWMVGFDYRVLTWLTHLNDLESLSALGSFSGRIGAYKQSYYLLSESSLGVGLGAWSNFSNYKYPHNMFLEILVEMPLLLGVCLILFMCVVFYSIKDSHYRVLFAIFVFMALFSGSIIDNRGPFFISMLFLLSFSRRRQQIH